VVCRASEGKEAISIDSGISRKSFVQLFATHAFDRVTPKAVHFSNNTHAFKAVIRLWLLACFGAFHQLVCRQCGIEDLSRAFNTGDR
jgi:hypothetical protein